MEWSTGLCECTDFKSCCYCFWCCPCLACDVSGKFGEKRWFPLCDIFSPACIAVFGIPLFAPPAGLSLRVGIRHRYGIKGNLLDDTVTACLCVYCSWNQMYRELKNREEQVSKTINMQPQEVWNAHTEPSLDGHVGPTSVILQPL